MTRRLLPLPGPFPLERGGILSGVEVAFETYGELGEGRDNAVWVCHALTGDAHPASHQEGDPPGWWEGMIGPGLPLDTRKWFIVCSNVLGGCSGTTGPSFPHPEDGLPWELRFPPITVGDMVRVQRELARALGIRRFALVVGGSLGAMQALEWAAQAPQRVQRVLALAGPWASSPQAIAWNEVGRQAILLDLERKGTGVGGMALARMLAMITYRSNQEFQARFGRRERLAPAESPHPFALQYQVESYLHHHGEKLVRRFDPYSYLYLTRAMDFFDLGAHPEETWEKVRAAGVRVMAAGIDSDILYPAVEIKELVRHLQKRGIRAVYEEIRSLHGHDAFLIEKEATGALVEKALHM
ncbi:MAG: homoserine O-acetyltransferase [Bacillota bacterium]|nr:homoserine O-acetyltransferase [Bacillota bacterium]